MKFTIVPSRVPTLPIGSEGIRYLDTQLDESDTDLTSDSLATSFSQARVFSNEVGGISILRNGLDEISESVPYLMGSDANLVYVIGATRLFFDSTDGISYTPRYAANYQMNHVGGYFMLTDGAGNQTQFYDFTHQTGDQPQGRLKSMTNPAGVVTLAEYNINGDLRNITQTIGSGVCAGEYSYTYYPEGDANAGLLKAVSWQEGASSAISKSVQYLYYAFGDCLPNSMANANGGELKTAVIRDGAEDDPKAAMVGVYAYTYMMSGGPKDRAGLGAVIDPTGLATLPTSVQNAFVGMIAWSSLSRTDIANAMSSASSVYNFFWGIGEAASVEYLWNTGVVFRGYFPFYDSTFYPVAA